MSTTVCAICGDQRRPHQPCGRCLFEREPPPATILDGAIELYEEVGEGAMSIVFRAHHHKLGREVAVKIPPATPEAKRRLLREATVMARLQHPNILPMLEVVERDEQAYLVLPYAPGGTLASRVPLEPRSVIELGIALADALEHAHARGVIHGDLKPENVLFDANGRPLLADFGIARVAEPYATTNNRGTPYFVAPEVLGGRDPDARSDVFSLGVLLHVARRGKLPAVGSEPPTRHPLDIVIARALREDPARRFASASAMRDALLAIGARRSQPRKRRWLVGLALAGVAMVGWRLHASRADVPFAGLWYMRSESIDERGGGSWVVDVTRADDGFLMNYGSGVMRCTFTGARCLGTWQGRSGEGWFSLELDADETRFAGTWGYFQKQFGRSAAIAGTRVK